MLHVKLLSIGLLRQYPIIVAGTLSLTTTKNPGTVFNLGTTVVTYTATDAAGNTSTCSFNVLVHDNTNPTITGCPSNITVTANASCQAVVNWTAPTVSDNCNGTILSSTKNPGAAFDLGYYSCYIHCNRCSRKHLNLFIQCNCSGQYQSL